MSEAIYLYHNKMHQDPVNNIKMVINGSLTCLARITKDGMHFWRLKDVSSCVLSCSVAQDNL